MPAPGRRLTPVDDAVSDTERLWRLVEVWLLAIDDLSTLLAGLDPTDALAATDLEGWNVGDVVAHVAHFEAVLAGAPEETIDVPAAPHLQRPMQTYTEAGVLARRGRLLSELVEEITQSVATRYAALRADPPSDPDAPAPRVPGGFDWSTGTVLRNRPLDVWVHEQDIRRALGRPGGFGSAPARHALAVLLLGLPMVVGRRVAPAAGSLVRLELPEAGLTRTVRVGDDGKAAEVPDDVEPTTTVRLSTEDFVVLAAGRRGPEATSPEISGDEHVGARLLASLGIMP